MQTDINKSINKQSAWKELGRFLKMHWMHLLLSPLLGFIFCSALHEGAHAVAAMAQGGEITEFRCWPGNGFLGHVSYHFPKGIAYSDTAISIAPYVFSLGLACISFIVAFCFDSIPFWLGSSIFAWGWIASFGNIGIGTSGYLRENRLSDLSKVFGPVQPGTSILLLGIMILGAILGFYLQERLYRERALSGRAYFLLVTLCVIGISICALFGRLM